MKTAQFALAAGALVTLGVSAFAQGTQTPNAMDKTFVMKAAMGGMNEMTLSKLALKKSSNPKVTGYATMMIQEHTVAGSQLKQVATKRELKAPMFPDAKHKALYASMSRLSGDSFDKAYVSAMITDHTQTVGLFQSEIAKGQSTDVTEFAKKNVGTIQAHLDHARSIGGVTDRPDGIMNPKQ